jgi:hypothetical protein
MTTQKRNVFASVDIHNLQQTLLQHFLAVLAIHDGICFWEKDKVGEA